MEYRIRYFRGEYSYTHVYSADKTLFIDRENATYPFETSPERAETIRTEYKRVMLGMEPNAVMVILGEPDEIGPLYEPVKVHAKHIGYTYWYVIKRATPNGSADDKQEALVRISFDINVRVNHVVHWGFGS
jgi:hypothetical protein